MINRWQALCVGFDADAVVAKHSEPNAPLLSSTLSHISTHSTILCFTHSLTLTNHHHVFYSLSFFFKPNQKQQRLDWSSSEDDTRMCKYKGKSEEVCQNYIKVLAKLGDERLLVCGTNAFKPKCRTYQYGPVSDRTRTTMFLFWASSVGMS